MSTDIIALPAFSRKCVPLQHEDSQHLLHSLSYTHPPSNHATTSSFCSVHHLKHKSPWKSEHQWFLVARDSWSQQGPA